MTFDVETKYDIGDIVVYVKDMDDGNGNSYTVLRIGKVIEIHIEKTANVTALEYHITQNSRTGFYDEISEGQIYGPLNEDTLAAIMKDSDRWWGDGE